MQAEVKQCQNCNHDFTIEPEDFAFYEKIDVPAPTFCPECRLIRRLAWRNERSLYKRTCSLCKNSIISMYDEYTTFPVYCPECWRSDNWDPMTYGQQYNFSEPFFEQFKRLMEKVPRVSLASNGNNVNSDYSNIVQDVKNVYLSYSVIWGSEDISYSCQVDRSKNIIDGLSVSESEYIYNSVNSLKNYGCSFTFFSENCVDSQFLYDCANCQNCFGCVNLRSESYCIWNEQYSKEAYKEKIQELWDGSYNKLTDHIQKFKDFKLSFPRKYARLVNCVNSTGDELSNSKNVQWGFSARQAEDSKYLYRCPGSVSNCYDASHLGKSEFVYEHAQGGSDQSSNLKFIAYGSPAQSNNEYCDYCGSSSYLFACIGLKNKQYCIFNQQYSKEEYEKLIPQIKQHMNDMPYVDTKGRTYIYGEFFPIELSPFDYNETIAMEYFPKTKTEVEGGGFRWRDKKDNQYTVTIKASELPDNINDVSDDILKEVIECEESSRAFKFTPSELQFYRKMNIPLPRLHPDIRYKYLLHERNPLKLWKRITEDGVEVMTPYNPDRPERILSEQGYKKEVL